MINESNFWTEQDMLDITLYSMQYVDTFYPDDWDQQIQSDLESGKLDHLMAKAEADIAANHVKDLDEVLSVNLKQKSHQS